MIRNNSYTSTQYMKMIENYQPFDVLGLQGHLPPLETSHPLCSFDYSKYGLNSLKFTLESINSLLYNGLLVSCLMKIVFKIEVLISKPLKRHLGTHGWYTFEISDHDTQHN